MRVCIDIGGTKTLLATVSDEGHVVNQIRFETPTAYHDFLNELKQAWSDLPDKDQIVGQLVVGAPGKIDREQGIVEYFGNLDWTFTPLRQDISAITGLDVYVENDANLAALGEYYELPGRPHQALYITVSTGIGTGMIADGKLDPNHLDSEGGQHLVEHNGTLMIWEKSASGSAIVKEFGLRASEIDDPAIWDDISKRLAIGIINLLSMTEPNVIIIGGGVGTHFNKFIKPLQRHMAELHSKLIDLPPIIQASQPEEAVILGSYQLSKQLD